jgi:hypothetical protein
MKSKLTIMRGGKVSGRPTLFPAGMEFVGAVLMIRWRPKYVSIRAVWLGVILQIAWVEGTAIWWAPLMMSLGSVRGEFSAIHWW